jgi:hypothetical protein
LKIAALKIIFFSMIAANTTCSFASLTSNKNLITPIDALETFLLPIREYLFTKSHHAIHSNRSATHHRWEFNQQNNIVHWTSALDVTPLGRHYNFQVYSEKSLYHLSFNLKYTGSSDDPDFKTFDLKSFQNMRWPGPKLNQTLMIAWPTPELFQTRWQITAHDQWLSTWISPAYNLQLSLQRMGQFYIYRCIQCLRHPNGPSAMEAKVQVTEDQLYPRYFLDGQEVPAIQFNQWINDVFLFTIKQSADMFVHFFLAPNIFYE